MEKRKFKKHGKIIITGIFIGVLIFVFAINIPEKLKASFLDDVSSDQLELTDIFDGKILTDRSANYKIDISEFAVPEGRISTDIRFKIQNNEVSSDWRSLFSVNSGGADSSPFQIIVVAKKTSEGDGGDSNVQFGLYFADPGVRSEERLIWIGDFEVEPGSESESGEEEVPGVELESTTNATSANFNGGNLFVGLGAISTCDTSMDAFANIIFKKGYLLGFENENNTNTTYTCDTELFDTEAPDLDIEESGLPGTGVIVQDRVKIMPVDIDNVVADASGATVYYEPSVQEMKVAATVDPDGNGDYRTIAEALQSVDEGMVALAGGEYYVESITVPDGVILSGGWDNIGFRTRNFTTNPTYIFQTGSADSLVQLAGDNAGLEGVILTGKNTCVKAFGRAHKITNNSFRECSIGIQVFGIAYAHIVNNTFYGFDTGILLEDFSAAKIVNNIFKSGRIAIQENSAT